MADRRIVVPQRVADGRLGGALVPTGDRIRTAVRADASASCIGRECPAESSPPGPTCRQESCTAHGCSSSHSCRGHSCSGNACSGESCSGHECKKKHVEVPTTGSAASVARQAVALALAALDDG
jgi:hypothetical protein